MIKLKFKYKIGNKIYFIFQPEGHPMIGSGIISYRKAIIFPDADKDRQVQIEYTIIPDDVIREKRMNWKFNGNRRFYKSYEEAVEVLLPVLKENLLSKKI